MKGKPILLYLFNSSTAKGKAFETSRNFEVKIFTNKDVVKLSERFICEKICYKNELTKSYKGREALNAFKRAYSKIPLSKREPCIVFLDSKGELIFKVTNVKSPGKLVRYMKLVLKKCK